jgi:hypothetical protein
MADPTEGRANNGFNKTFEQAAAFQQLWISSFAKMAQAAFAVTPESTPPEMMRQVRSSLFQAMAQAWEEFTRSPQFLEGTRQLLENATAFRRLTNDIFTRARHETQGAAREDIDTLTLAMRHMERRIRQEIEGLTNQIGKISKELEELKRPSAFPSAPEVGAEPAARVKSAVRTRRRASKTKPRSL